MLSDGAKSLSVALLFVFISPIWQMLPVGAALSLSLLIILKQKKDRKYPEIKSDPLENPARPHSAQSMFSPLR